MGGGREERVGWCGVCKPRRELHTDVSENYRGVLCRVAERHALVQRTVSGEVKVLPLTKTMQSTARDQFGGRMPWIDRTRRSFSNDSAMLW